MAIAKAKPTAPKPVDPVQVEVVAPSYRGTTVDTKYTPLASMLQYVEGSNWSVTYYSQVLGADSEPMPLALDRAPVYQQYTRILQMELKVTTPLTSQEDPETHSFITTGAATSYPHFIPNKGDMFLADIGDGREGLFVVTNTEKRTILKESFFSIEYQITTYSDSDRQAYLDNLDFKTVRTTHFVKDFLVFGQNPQVLSEDYNDLRSFKREYEDLIGLYFHDFFSHRYQTLLVPDQDKITYDPFLTTALMDVVDTEEHPHINRMRLPSVEGDLAMLGPTLWDALCKLSYATFQTAVFKMGTITTDQFRSLPHYGGVYYSGIEKVVYPRDRRTDIDRVVSPTPCVTTPLGTLGVGQMRYGELERLAIEPDQTKFFTTQDGQLLPDIAPVTMDDYYVLTGKLYRNEEPMSSNLERLVEALLRGDAIDKGILHRLATTAKHWPNLERFYYIPILLVLLKTVMRTN